MLKLERWKVFMLIVNLSLLSIFVESQSQLKVDHSWKLISVECRSQLKVDLSWKLISVESWSQLKVNLSWKSISVESLSDSWWLLMNDLMMFLGFGHRLTDWLTNGRTTLVVKSLSRLITFKIMHYSSHLAHVTDASSGDSVPFSVDRIVNVRPLIAGHKFDSFFIFLDAIKPFS